MTISKPILKHNFTDDLKHICWIVLGVLGFSILPQIFLAFEPEVQVTGVEFMFGLILLIGWASYYEEHTHFYAQHGVSRRTMFTSSTVAMAISSALFAIAFMVAAGLLVLLSAVLPVSISVSTLFTQHLAGVGTALGLLVHFVWTWSILLAFSAVGQFGASLYYILSKLGRYIALGVIIFVVVVLPRFLIPMLGNIENMIDAIVHMFVYGGNWGNPGMSIALALGVATVCLISSWLCMRRCQMKK